jgi:hypothetical protein
LFVLLGVFAPIGDPAQDYPDNYQEWDRWRHDRDAGR